MKKLLALALAAVLVITLFGCGKKQREPIELTLSTEDSAAILNAAGIRLPSVEEVSAAGSTITYFSWFDSIRNYTEDEIVNTGYWTFKNMYGCEVEYIEASYNDRYEQLARYIMADDSPDFFPAGISSEATFPMYCIKGTFLPVDDYIDYSDKLWEGMEEAADYFALGKHHFALVTDVTFRDICPYNKRVVDSWGFEDPAELYYNDEWTWDVFYDMCMEFSSEDDNRFALEGYTFNGALNQEATGAKFIYKDENGKYYSNIDDPIFEAVNDLLYNLVKNGCTYHEGNDYWAGRNDHQVGAGVKDGQTLFYMCLFGNIQGPVAEMSEVWGDIAAGELMYVPLPRWQEGDGNYYLAAIPTGYMIVSGAKNPEGVALFAQCERFKIIDPTVVRIDRKQLEEVYLWNQDMLDMYDECREIVLNNTTMYLNGNLIDNLNTVYNHFRDDIARSANTTWAQLKETYSDSFDYYLEEQNKIIEDYIAENS